MSGFGQGFAFGYLTTSSHCMPYFGYGYGYSPYLGFGFNREMVMGSDLIYSCYADLDRPSGLSSAFPSVDYAMNSPFYGGYSGFSYSPFGFGLGCIGGFGYYC